jgi:hypothetical protein
MFANCCGKLRDCLLVQIRQSGEPTRQGYHNLVGSNTFDYCITYCHRLQKAKAVLSQGTDEER